jgi:hypothetical protein
MIKKLAEAPEEVRTAFENVRQCYQDVVSVAFESTEDFHGWTYLDSRGEAPNFDDTGIDVDLLEYALDSVEDFPVTYQL